MTVWRPLDGIPVFAKAGGIVPMQPLSEGDSINSVDNPQHGDHRLPRSGRRLHADGGFGTLLSADHPGDHRDHLSMAQGRRHIRTHGIASPGRRSRSAGPERRSACSPGRQSVNVSLGWRYRECGCGAVLAPSIGDRGGRRGDLPRVMPESSISVKSHPSGEDDDLQMLRVVDGVDGIPLDGLHRHDAAGLREHGNSVERTPRRSCAVRWAKTRYTGAR